jgi:Dockerin type I domain
MHIAMISHRWRMRLQTSAAAGAILCAILCLAKTASAVGVLLDSHGFDGPTYTPGVLDDQDIWRHVRSPNPGSLGTAVVQTGGGSPTGGQSVLVTRGANSYDWWGSRGSADPAGITPQRFVIVDWDMRADQTTQPSALGPFLGVEAFDQADVSNNPALSGVLAAFGVDATTGELLYGTASGFLSTGAAPIDFGSWNHYRVVLDYSGSRSYRVFFNGAQLGSSHNFMDTTPALTKFSRSAIAALAVAGDLNSLVAPATAYVDNYVVRNGLLGDYDVDGDVDAADFTAWKQSLNNTVSSAGFFADGNNSGNVDAGDYTIWRDNFGTSLFTPIGSGGLAGNNAVPEPSSWLLLFLGLMPARWMLGRRRN